MSEFTAMSSPVASDWNFFADLPVGLQIVFWFEFAIAVSTLVSVITLLISAYAAAGRRRRRGQERQGEGDYLWVFLVPALNEEITIADSVGRLRALNATNKVIMAIDDGSDDRTGLILEELAGPDLVVLTRTRPQARTGKGAALNDAYRRVRAAIEPGGAFAGWPADKVIIAIADADGRLDADAAEAVSWHFGDPRIAGVQLRVRIYNRSGFLTWAQDVEFGTFGLVFQAGRSGWGTASMGGNGQFNRLSALESVHDAESGGPWRDRLTEDLDLGMRLLQAGFRGAQENTVVVSQQGLPGLRRLYRQRTRWAQGNWQCLPMLGDVGRLRAGLIARIDNVYYLLTPVLQLCTGIGLIAAIVAWAVLDIPFWPGTLLTVVIFLTLGFGPGFAALLLRGSGWKRIPLAILLALPYTVYSWMIFPVVTIGLLRQLSGRRAWVKTPRVAIGEVASDDSASDRA